MESEESIPSGGRDQPVSATQAQRALRALRAVTGARAAAGRATCYPWWYPLALATSIAAIDVSRLLPGLLQAAVNLAAALSLLGFVIHFRARYGVVLVNAWRLPGMRPRVAVAVTILAAVVVTTAVLDLGYDQRWIYLPAAVVNFGVLFVLGLAIRRALRELGESG